MPMTSSLFSPTTGIREKPLRSASDSTCRTFLSRSAKTMSVRGTMTSRTIVSPNSNTEWIISRSPGSMTRRSPSRSTSPRRSSSDSAGPSLAPRPGVSALPAASSSRGSGPSAWTVGNEHPRRGPGQLPVVLTAQGNRPDPGHDVQQRGHARQGDEERVPAGA